ncbi:hypothetical protein MTO96_043732 [Rhipicephalus appendiculatus]
MRLNVNRPIKRLQHKLMALVTLGDQDTLALPECENLFYQKAMNKGPQGKENGPRFLESLHPEETSKPIHQRKSSQKPQSSVRKLACLLTTSPVMEPAGTDQYGSCLA